MGEAHLAKTDATLLCLICIQQYFLLKLISGDIDLNKENTPEFDQYSWVPFWFPLNQVVDFKKEAYRSALIDFRNQVSK